MSVGALEDCNLTGQMIMIDPTNPENLVLETSQSADTK